MVVLRHASRPVEFLTLVVCWSSLRANGISSLSVTRLGFEITQTAKVFAAQNGTADLVVQFVSVRPLHLCSDT